MMRPVYACLNWLEARTGLQTSTKRFLLEDIPASAGWPQVFGSVGLFVLGVQFFTGILLALNYAPTPGEAYLSVTYIIHSVTAGKLVRGLHHWGASMLLVVVIAHMLQVFLYGAYKKPREVTWIAGVTLLLAVLCFDLTGYLLPWDNRAYWASLVTTRLVAQVPLVGPHLSELIGAAGGIGAPTLTRFYAIHVIILPVASVSLILLHVYLVRKHGVTPSAGDDGRRRPFYPVQAYRDMIAIFIAFVLLFAAAMLLDAPLEGAANPGDSRYTPRPEWYFLFLFQALKYFRGSLEPVGSVVLPSLAVVALLAVPFIDRGAARSLRQRSLAGAIAILGVALWGLLTLQALTSS